jgi:DNA polymerase-3 subunit gamma/tau
MSLYNKYRPQDLRDLFGNEDVIVSISNMLEKPEEFPHAILLTGPTGCGKTTLGRIIAKEIGCGKQDYHEVDSADFRGIDTVREIRRQSQFASMYQSPVRVWLMDECHKLSNDAQNALLKALEDPPKHVFYILCTTDPQKLIETVKGRCSIFEMETLNEKYMFRLLRRIAKEEGQTLETNIMDTIIDSAQGHPRNAIQILEQVLRVDPERRLAVAKQRIDFETDIKDLCESMMKQLSWEKVRKILENLKDQEPEKIRRACIGLAANRLMKYNDDSLDIAAMIIEQMIEPTYNTGWAGIVFACYSICTPPESSEYNSQSGVNYNEGLEYNDIPF